MGLETSKMKKYQMLDQSWIYRVKRSVRLWVIHNVVNVHKESGPAHRRHVEESHRVTGHESVRCCLADAKKLRKAEEGKEKEIMVLIGLQTAVSKRTSDQSKERMQQEVRRLAEVSNTTRSKKKENDLLRNQRKGRLRR